jgi:glycine/D-amino acid oxidase-like deaminating enzyme
MTERPCWESPSGEPLPAFDVGRRKSEDALPARVDSVVVGAGFTGLSAARTLARQGASVAVIEGERIGFGASSRSAGQVLTGLPTDPAALIARYGERRARELFDAATQSIAHLEGLIAAESIDCGYQRSGHIQLAAKASHFAAFRDEQSLLARVFNHDVQLLSRQEQHAEIGSDRYHGVLVDRRSGSLNPAACVSGLARAARHAGACIYSGVVVNHVSRNSHDWSVTTSRGTLSARDVLFATNGYGGAASPALQRRFVPIGSYTIATAPLTDAQCDAVLPTRRMAFDSRHFLDYFRLTPDARLLFGGRTEFSEPSPASTMRAARLLRRRMDAVFPALSRVPTEYVWSGRVAFTRDRLPHAGRLDDGTWFAGGYCGHGIAMATELGSAVARRMLGDRTPHPFVDDRCPVIPMYNGRPWFLPLAGAYYQVKDWMS